MTPMRVENLFFELDQDHDGKIPKNEYVRSCLQIEDLVKQKTLQSVNSLRGFQMKYEDVKAKLTEAKVSSGGAGNRKN